MNLTDTYVVRDASGEIDEYVFIDPSRTTHYRGAGRDGYETTVSFLMNSKIGMNYPVVFDDLTTSSGESLERIAYEDVPPAVKRRLVAWLKLQPQPACGPAGAPDRNLDGTPNQHAGAKAGNAKETGSDRVKDEIVRAHPDTRAGDWKRRSRTKTPEGVTRTFEHADGRTVDTVERADGGIVVTGGDMPKKPTGGGQGVRMEYPDAEHSGIEFYVSGPAVDRLKAGFEDFGDNPDVVALFQSKASLYDDGEYNGDGCDRLEIERGVLWAAMDGLMPDIIGGLVDECIECADEHPDLSYMVVASHPVGDDRIQRYDVLFRKGFDAQSNPMKGVHGRFYDEYVVRGI